MVGIGEIASVASIGSSLGGLFGKKKSKSVAQSKPYFRPVNETLNDVDKTLDYLKSTQNYTERPMRAMTQDEMYNPIFKQNAVMDIKNYFDSEAANKAADDNPYGDADLNKIGRDYVQNYGQVGGINPTYWSNLQAKSNFDYEAIAKALLDTQNDSSTFGKNEAYLRQVGLGYAPKGLPKGVTMPTTGVPR